MRFNCKKYGDKRIVKRFALFPISTYIDPEDKLNCQKIVVWLETVYLFQKVECGITYPVWATMRFATRDEYLKYKEEKTNELS